MTHLTFPAWLPDSISRPATVTVTHGARCGLSAHERAVDSDLPQPYDVTSRYVTCAWSTSHVALSRHKITLSCIHGDGACAAGHLFTWLIE